MKDSRKFKGTEWSEAGYSSRLGFYVDEKKDYLKVNRKARTDR